METLPKHLSSADIEQWLESFDRCSAQRTRDYEMARCLANLWIARMWKSYSIFDLCAVGCGGARLSTTLPRFPWRWACQLYITEICR
jgi:hypothetical protein